MKLSMIATTGTGRGSRRPSVGSTTSEVARPDPELIGQRPAQRQAGRGARHAAAVGVAGDGQSGARGPGR